MQRRWSKRRTGLVALILAVGLIAASCADKDNNDSSSSSGGSSEDLKGKTVTMFGPEVEQEAQGLKDTFAKFEKDTGITIKYSGDRSFEQQIGVRVDGGNAPDIAWFPQPGKIKDFKDDLKPLPDDVSDTVKSSFIKGFVDLLTVDGKVYAVPAKADLKSLVWYSPAEFEKQGYEIPETMEDFNALTKKMIADGKTPLCVGLGSDAATGWPFTDWVEDYMLRMKGPEVYDKWVNHEIPFNDPDVTEVVNAVYDMWNTKGMVYGGVKSVASTPFADAGLPLLQGKCEMHRQGNFYAANWPKGTKLGPKGQVNAFYLPTFADKDFGRVTLTGGISAAAFSDRPEVKKVLEFIASPAYANTRAPVQGFLSPNLDTDKAKYPDDITRQFADILAKADPPRFDASDQMPGEVGSGSFWKAAVAITTGNQSIDQALETVENSWPSK
jgi:alpha-glucoside transport system substrate-binding protein